MLRANIARSGLRGSAARPLARQPRATNVRTAMYKNEGPDKASSSLEWTPKTYAMIGGSILAVAGGYGYMMGHPDQVVRTEKSPVAITESAADKTKK